MVASKIKVWLKENLNSTLIILGVILGLIFGCILRSFFTVSPVMLTYIGLPGHLMIRAFMLLLVPLIIASLSTGISATKIGENKRLVVLSLLLIVLFTSLVSIFGVLFTVTMRPGVREVGSNEINTEKNSSHENSEAKRMTSQEETIYDVFINLVPDNIVGASIMTHYTALVPINAQNLSEGYKKVLEKSFSPNLLGLVVFSMVLGIALLHLEERAHTIKALLEETNLIIMEIIQSLMILMPIGMFSWMCVEAIKMKSPGVKDIVNLAWFAGTAVLALLVIFLVFYPAIYFFALGRNPFKMYYNIFPAMLLAFGSSSSAITLPATMKCMEENHKLALPISHFFLPLGMTMHMPGTATYCPMVAIFVAQMHGIPLTFPMLATLSIYSTVMSMAFPATPSQSGLMFFITICALIGIENPADIIAYISSIDLVIGRLRTTINITGDCVIASIVEKYCHNKQEATETLELKVNSSRL